MGCWSSNHSKAERLQALQKTNWFKQSQAAVHALASAFNTDAPSEEINLNDLDGDIVSHLLSLSEEAIQETEGTANSTNPSNSPESNYQSNFVSVCNNVACSYNITATLPPFTPTSHSTDGTTAMSHRYKASVLRGIMLDSGCLYFSTGVIPQYLAYCQTFGLVPHINRTKTKSVTFGDFKHM